MVDSLLIKARLSLFLGSSLSLYRCNKSMRPCPQVVTRKPLLLSLLMKPPTMVNNSVAISPAIIKRQEAQNSRDKVTTWLQAHQAGQARGRMRLCVSIRPLDRTIHAKNSPASAPLHSGARGLAERCNNVRSWAMMLSVYQGRLTYELLVLIKQLPLLFIIISYKPAALAFASSKLI